MNGPINKDHLDPLSPPPPVEAYRDPETEAWVLSRYAEVLAAFREPALRMGRGGGKDLPEISNASRQQQIRSETLAVLSASNLARWQAQVEPIAFALIDRLPGSRRVDIVQEFARPWSLSAATIVTGADPADSERLESLAAKVSLATADPSNPAHQREMVAANTELKKRLQNSAIPMSGPAFVALSQTLPCFLANAWLALLRHPSELARLRNEADLMPRAIEELLRYAGIAQKVSRYAAAELTLGATLVEQGGHVILMLASANRDPEQFPVPNHLDVTRRTSGHVAFGLGPHSCAAATLIRTMAAVATRAFVERFVEGHSNDAIEWQGGSGFRWASSLYVLLNKIPVR
ncbi:MAG: cytochrome P450 [Bryobacteraceae bacterium]